MDEIKQQVSSARRRIVLQQFSGILTWSLFVTLVIAALGLAIPKLWALAATNTESGAQIWAWSWIGGSVFAGLAVAIIGTYFVRRGEMEAAIEVDRRFGLKERISSVLAMQPRDLDTDAGRALLADAARCAETVDVKEQFRFSLGRRSLLPLLPALVVVLLVVAVGNRALEQEVEAKETALAIETHVKASEDQFKKNLAKKRAELEDDGLKDAAAWFKEIEQQYEQATNNAKANRKEALVRLNNVKKQVESKQNQLAKANAMRKQLSQLKNIKQGPTEKALEAMKDGNFGKAMEEVKKLADQMREGKLDAEQKKQVQDQIEQLQEQLNEHQRAKEELREQIADAKKKGNQAKADKLKDALEKLQKRDPDMRQLEQLAKNLDNLKNNLDADDLQQAADDLEQLASDLQDLQSELDQLETLDDVMDEIAKAKNAMACKQCQGEGCAACSGQGNKPAQGGQQQLAGGQGKGNDKKPGSGLGEGSGEGARPENPNDTKFYESKVDADPKAGQVERIGDADGANIVGLTREEAKRAIKNRMSKEADPVVDQPLPRNQREHVREYFEQFNKP